MIESPDIRWKTLPEMSNDELDFGESIKNPISAQSKGMDTHTSGKDLGAPSCSIVPKLFPDGWRRETRMHVHRYPKILHRLPENIVVIAVIKQHGVTVRTRRLPFQRQSLPLIGGPTIIEHAADESEFFNGASEFLGSLSRIVHRDGSKALETSGVLRTDIGHVIIGSFGKHFRFLLVRLALAAWRCDGEDHHSHAVFVPAHHQQPNIVERTFHPGEWDHGRPKVGSPTAIPQVAHGHPALCNFWPVH